MKYPYPKREDLRCALHQEPHGLGNLLKNIENLMQPHFEIIDLSNIHYHSQKKSTLSFKVTFLGWSSDLLRVKSNDLQFGIQKAMD